MSEFRSSAGGFILGELVRIKPLDDARRDVLYRGWVGRIRRFRANEAFVDTDGYKQVQAVTFRDWFGLDELEHLEGELSEAIEKASQASEARGNT